MRHEAFHYASAQELLDAAQENGLTLPYSSDLSVLSAPLVLGGKTIPNRLLAQPIEGFDAEPDGAPSPRTIRRYRELAQGGSGSLWMESTSVNHQGRSNPMQLWITKENLGQFRTLVQEIRAAAPGPIYLVLQLTHSGRNSNPDGISTPICGFHSSAIPKENEQIISDAALEALEQDYVTAACLAEEAGFDAVDIRACHGYLINELFAAVHRPGPYGGCFENRVRLLMNIIRKLQQVSSIEIGVRLNLYDGIPYPDGWGVDPEHPGVMDLTEPLALIRLLYAQGIRLLNITSGVGAYSPYVIRPYNRGGIPAPEHPLEGIARMQEGARLAKEAAPEAIVVASAFSWLQTYAPQVAAGGVSAGWYDLAGFGRQSIADPGYANDILKNGGLSNTALCTACCGCTTLIKKSGKKLRCIFRKTADD